VKERGKETAHSCNIDDRLTP